MTTIASASLAAVSPHSNQVETFKLENGLTVLVLPDDRLPRAFVEVVYRVGSANEPPGKSGFAHLFEHLMFEGSRNVPEGAFDTWLESAGGDNNAWTSVDRTTYYENVPSNAVELALFLEADRMGGLLDGMPDSVVDGQREVVRNERRQRYEVRPYAQADLLLTDALYPVGHPYHLPVIGSHQDLAAASADDVRAFFRRFYTPSNASLMIAGDITLERARELVERWFGPIAEAPAPKAPKAATVKLQGQTRLMLEDDVELPKLLLAWTSPRWLEPGDAALDLVTDILTEGRTGRLRKRLVDELGLVQSVSAWQASRNLAGHFEIEILARAGVDLDRVLEVVEEEIDRFKKEGPTADEVLQARRAAQVEALDRAERLSSRASKVHSYWLATGRTDGLTADLDRYLRLDAKALQKAAQDFLGPDFVAISVVPPGETALALKGSAPAKPEPPAPPSQEPGEQSQRSPPLLARPQPAAAPSLVLPRVKTSWLKNGARLFVTQRPGTALVDLRITLPGGADRDAAGSEGLAYLAAEMATRGAGELEAVPFAAALRSLGASLEVWAGWDATWLSLHMPADVAPQAVSLLTEVLLAPRFAKDEWRRLAEEESADRLRVRSATRALLGLAQQRARYGADHRRGVRLRGTAQTVKKLSLDAAQKAWHQEANPAHAAIFLVGDVDEASQKAILAPLDRWRARAVERGAARLSHLKGAADIGAQGQQPSVWWVDRKEAVQSALAVSGPWVERTPLLDPATVVMRTLLGGSFASRLNHNLREVHQYAYGASAFLVRNPWGSYLSVRSQVAVVSTAAAIGEIFKELDRIQTPAEAKELSRASTYALLTLPDDFETGRGTAAELAWLYSEGGDLSSTRALAEGLTSLSPTRVAAAARSVLVGELSTIVGVGDLNAVRPQLEAAGFGTARVFEIDELLGTETKP